MDFFEPLDLYKKEPTEEKLSGDKIQVSAEIENTGRVDGNEVVQIYISSNNTEKDRPVKLLKGFRRVGVKRAQTASVNIDVEPDDIRFYNLDNGSWELDNSYTVYIGSDSRNVAAVDKITL